MIVNLQNPIVAIRGALSLDSRYYARMLNGQCVIQRKPNRSNHLPTQEETANRQRFIARYRKTRV